MAMAMASLPSVLKGDVSSLSSSSSSIFLRASALRSSPTSLPPLLPQQRKFACRASATVHDPERFHLANLGPQPGSRKKAKRKGRGIGAGQGASCGFGMRGQKSRSGPGVRPGFEGGQTPLYRRLPKLRGIAGGMSAGLPKFVTVNLADIELGGFEEGEEVSLESLKSRGILNPSGRDRRLRLKVLGDGELNSKLCIKAGAFSESAKSKLEAAGCTLTLVPGPKKWLKPSVLKHQQRAADYFAKKFASTPRTEIAASTAEE